MQMEYAYRYRTTARGPQILLRIGLRNFAVTLEIGTDFSKCQGLRLLFGFNMYRLCNSELCLLLRREP